MEKRILVVEDEAAIRDIVVINLERAGFSVAEAGNGEAALVAAREEAFDAVLLDITLPGIDGFEVCRELRAQSDTIGIIFLTARTQEDDKVGGLKMGADDYVTKPFSPSELVARVEAVCRRVQLAASAPREVEVESGPFLLNTRSRTLYKDGRPVPLTQVEYQIVELLMRRHGEAIDRGQILKEVWSGQACADPKIVDVNVRRLRVKLEDEPSHPLYLQTVWGYGYKWCP